MKIQWKAEKEKVKGFKAFDISEVKVQDEEQRVIEGYITARSFDREGDRVPPTAFLKQFQAYEANPDLLPVLLYVHDQRSRLPLGKILAFKIKDKGTWFQAQLSRATEFANEAWGQVKEGILKTFSFGYTLHDYVPNEIGGRDFIEAEIMEVSFAPVAAQPEAQLESFKSLELKTINLEREDLEMEKVELKDLVTFEQFSNKMKEISESMEELKKSIGAEPGKMIPEELVKVEKLLADMATKQDQLQADMAKRFPARQIQFTSDFQPLLTGEKAYAELVETPSAYFGDERAKKVKRFQEMHDVVMLANIMLEEKAKANRRKYLPAWEYVKQSFGEERDGIKSLRRLVREWNMVGDELTGGELSKALATGAAGLGAEFIPTAFSAQLIDQVRASLVIPGRFMQFQAPSDPWKFPVNSADIYGVGVAQSTAVPSAFDAGATATGTANVTFTHSKMRMRDFVSAEEIEDSIVAIVPYVNNKFAIGAAKTLERALINGQRAGVHQDNDVEVITEVTAGFRRGIAGCPLWDGLRWLCLNPAAGVTAKLDAGGTGAYILDDYPDSMTFMGKYGLPNEINNCFVTMGYAAYYLALKFAGLKSIADFGPFATVVNGVLTKLYGMDVIPSGEFPVNLAATGVNTVGGPNTTTAALIVNQNAFAVTYRRGFQLEAVRWAAQDQFEILGFMRVSFSPWRKDSAGKFAETDGSPASYLYNIIK
jgi:HK97 family phage prohead protease/HK97 family phage major capsid protein